jgi:hypothetical protein
LEKIELEKDL